MKVVVITDPNLDPDDEFAIALLAALSKIHSFSLKIIITKGGKLTSWDDFRKHLSINTDDIQVFVDSRDPKQVVKPTDPLDPSHIVLISPDADGLIIDGFLDIANVRYVAFQGNAPCKEKLPNVLCHKWDETRAANDAGNVNFFKGLQCECTIRAVTTVDCQGLCFGKPFFKHYRVPEYLKEKILKNVFKLIVGRINPAIPLARAIAVSLITESIKGSTVKLARNLQDITKMKQVQMSDELEEAVDNYLSDLTSNGIELCNDTRDGLEEICQSLTALLGGKEPYYKDDEGKNRLYTSTDENGENNDLSSTLNKEYKTFKQIQKLTPVFDLHCAKWFCKDVFGYVPDNVHFFPRKNMGLRSMITIISVAVVGLGILWKLR